MMRTVYLDEAGADNESPVIVLAGFIVENEEHEKRISLCIEKLISLYIPEEDRADFAFHAMDIYQGTGYFEDRDKWSVSTRVNILENLLNIFFKSRTCICYNYIFDENLKNKSDIKHILCHALLSLDLDGYMKRLHPEEKYCIVAEDGPSVKNKIKKTNEILLNPDDKFKAILGGRVPVQDTLFSFDFCKKTDSNLLQLADALAYVIKRYVQNKEYSEMLMKYVFPVQFLQKFFEDKPFGGAIIHIYDMPKR
ncbi:MAG: DUF3800 domain-containing protein [Nitrospinae bacterium]|nr:DUF3800 domain-containing protein [Nitrospinota bacterium]